MILTRTTAEGPDLGDLAMILPSASCTIPIASSASCLWRSCTGGSTARPSRKTSQSRSIHLMVLCFSSFMRRDPNRDRIFWPSSGARTHLVSSVSRFSSAPSMAPGLAARPGCHGEDEAGCRPRDAERVRPPAQISTVAQTCHSHAMSQPIPLQLSRLRGRAVRQTSQTQLRVWDVLYLARHSQTGARIRPACTLCP